MEKISRFRSLRQRIRKYARGRYFKSRDIERLTMVDKANCYLKGYEDCIYGMPRNPRQYLNQYNYGWHDASLNRQKDLSAIFMKGKDFFKSREQ